MLCSFNVHLKKCSFKNCGLTKCCKNTVNLKIVDQRSFKKVQLKC